MVEKCTETSTDSKVKISERGRTAIFNNPKRKLYQKIKIDDCVITDGIRADYLVNEGDEYSVIVELKGRDIQHACEQLIATYLNSKVKSLLKPQIGLLVVGSKIPSFDTAVARAKQLCATKYKIGFHTKSDKGEFDISKLASIGTKK